MRRLLFSLFVTLAVTISTSAQTFRGTINGTVTDPAGAVVPNAQVKATEVATGIDHNTVATNDGQFAFQDIPVGAYKVTVRLGIRTCVHKPNFSEARASRTPGL